MDTDRKVDTVSTMDEGKRQKRPLRSFTDEFKAGAVRLVRDEGKTIPQVARDLDLTESALRTWVERARADRTQGKTGLTTVEREELARLRKENRELRMEREILKKAAAFFAKEHPEVCLHRRGEGLLPYQAALQSAARLARRLLRLAPAPALDAGAAGPAADGDDPRRA